LGTNIGTRTISGLAALWDHCFLENLSYQGLYKYYGRPDKNYQKVTNTKETIVIWYQTNQGSYSYQEPRNIMETRTVVGIMV
jgi:hypothetical protein